MRKLLVLFLILLSSTCFGATRQKTWSTGDTITENDMNADWDNFYSEKVTASNIANGAVGNSQLGTITAANKINFSSIFTAGQSQGDIAYYNGSAWTRLGAGTDGQYLKTQGAAANPVWASVSFPWTNVIWVNTDGAGNINDDYGVASITNGDGDDTITYDANFGNANYCAIAGSNGNNATFCSVGQMAVGSCHVLTRTDGGAATNNAYSLTCFGD